MLISFGPIISDLKFHVMKYPPPPKIPLAPIQKGIHPMPEDDLLNLYQEAHKLGFKDATDLSNKEIPNVSIQWLASELFDPLVSRKSVEALGDLFRAACIEQSISYSVLPSACLITPNGHLGCLSLPNDGVSLRDSKLARALKLGLQSPCMLVTFSPESFIIKVMWWEETLLCPWFLSSKYWGGGDIAIVCLLPSHSWCEVMEFHVPSVPSI
ncbi:hypothetical protein ACH5RR_029595 [Cinchona calisaya]|uniref:Uncharacterized protein n=1 Tax=Cinchona calisaya TaxID=153742 RepID=A0ABD2YS42_9GENT